MSSTLHVQRVVVFLYVGSRRLLHNLTDMHRKASAGLGLHVAMVPESYQWSFMQGPPTIFLYLPVEMLLWHVAFVFGMYLCMIFYLTSQPQNNPMIGSICVCGVDPSSLVATGSSQL
jgi:hypothetical protein